jgi:hypothetical protein
MNEAQDRVDPAETEPDWLAPVTDSVPVREQAGPIWFPPPRSPAELDAQVQQVRSLTTVTPTTVVRRGLFMWLRIFVLEEKASGKRSRVNMRIPIPLPLIGLLLPWRMSSRQALAVLNQMYESEEGAALAERTLAGHTAFEFIHVEESNPKTGAWSYVVMGLE